MNKTRCTWSLKHDIETRYHDEEWGVPLYDDQALFECLLLEGAQAGLSWYTVLTKRENYRAAFDQFDPEKMARYDEAKKVALLQNSGIIRNRLKIKAAIGNAQAFLQLKDEGTSFRDFVWSVVDGRPVQNSWKKMTEIPTSTPQSDLLSKRLKKRGFKFVGSTICYAFMEAVGMVNDHTTDCWRYEPIRAMGIH